MYHVWIARLWEGKEAAKISRLVLLFVKIADGNLVQFSEPLRQGCNRTASLSRHFSCDNGRWSNHVVIRNSAPIHVSQQFDSNRFAVKAERRQDSRLVVLVRLDICCVVRISADSIFHSKQRGRIKF